MPAAIHHDPSCPTLNAHRVTDGLGRELLASPKSEWPKRVDGKLNMLQASFDKAEVEAAKTAKALAEAKTALDNYKNLLRQGEY